jgi:hypothetical protein
MHIPHSETRGDAFCTSKIWATLVVDGCQGGTWGVCAAAFTGADVASGDEATLVMQHQDGTIPPQRQTPLAIDAGSLRPG